MALSANAEIPRMTGELKSYLVADNVHIFKGALVCVEPAAGYALPGADTARLSFVGIAAEECDNTLTGHTAGGRVFEFGIRVNSYLTRHFNHAGYGRTDDVPRR